MKCPYCKSENYEKTELSRPKNRVYYVQQLDTCTIRYRICLGCGRKWKTVETYYDEVKSQRPVNRQ